MLMLVQIFRAGKPPFGCMKPLYKSWDKLPTSTGNFWTFWTINTIALVSGSSAPAGVELDFLIDELNWIPTPHGWGDPNDPRRAASGHRVRSDPSDWLPTSNFFDEKKTEPTNYPWNTDWLIGIHIIMVDCNPYVTGSDFIPYKP